MRHDKSSPLDGLGRILAECVLVFSAWVAVFAFLRLNGNDPGYPHAWDEVACHDIRQVFQDLGRPDAWACGGEYSWFAPRAYGYYRLQLTADARGTVIQAVTSEFRGIEGLGSRRIVRRAQCPAGEARGCGVPEPDRAQAREH